MNIVWSRQLPKGCKPSTVTISKDGARRYFVSLLVEEEIKSLEVTPKMIGLDLGLTSMVITSNEESYGNPKFFAQDEKRLARVQRRHAKKKKGSKNKKKARVKSLPRTFWFKPVITFGLLRITTFISSSPCVSHAIQP